MTRATSARMGFIGSESLVKLPAAAFAMLFGAFIVYGVGFAPIEVVHNAAHDGRHAFAFPCH